MNRSISIFNPGCPTLTSPLKASWTCGLDVAGWRLLLLQAPGASLPLLLVLIPEIECDATARVRTCIVF